MKAVACFCILLAVAPFRGQFPKVLCCTVSLCMIRNGPHGWEGAGLFAQASYEHGVRQVDSGLWPD